MAKKSKTSRYTRQTFYDVAIRRCAEAAMLLSPPHKHCDGAVTCSLLAAECALKATLLHGSGVNSPDDLPNVIREKIFEGKSGHRVDILWSQQPARVQARKTIELQEALSHLNQADRYAYRYGVRKPLPKDAHPYIDSCNAVVRWMKDLLR